MSFVIGVSVVVVLALALYTWLKPKPIPGVPLLGGISTALQFGSTPKIITIIFYNIMLNHYFLTENPAKLLLDARKLGNVFTVDLSLLRMTLSFRNEDIQHFFKAQESELTLQCMDTTSRSNLNYC